MVRWYVLTGLGLMLSILALTRRENIRANLALICLSSLLGIYVLEAVILLTRGEIGIEWDKRSKIEIVEDLRDKGISAFTMIGPWNWLDGNGSEIPSSNFFPLAGISRTSTVFCNESGTWITYESDEHGFRNPKGQYNKGSIDVVLIGDSFTHGACVPKDDTVAERLRIAGYRVLSLGYAGNGPLIELATLTEFAQPLQPKVILWIYFEGNDNWELLLEERSQFLRRYLNRSFSQNLLERQHEVDQFLENYWRKEFSAFRTWEAKFVETIPDFLVLVRVRGLMSTLTSAPLFQTPPSPMLKEVLREAKKGTLDWGGQLYFVYLPSIEKYSLHKVNDPVKEEVLSIVMALGIPLIDFQGRLDSQPDPLSYFAHRKGPHYAASGYKLLADQIIDVLSAEKILPPKVS
jgi:hypothetical protein